MRVRLPLLPLDWAEVMGLHPHWARLRARYANRQSGQAQTLVKDCGFDSHPCYLAKWWNGRHATLRTSCLAGVGVRLSPWSLRSGLEPGFQHGLIRRPTPVQIRPPQMRGEGRGARDEGRERPIRCPLPLLRKVAGYGWPGRSAKAVLLTEMRVQVPCLPLAAPMVKRTIIPRFERGVLGSNPGRGIGKGEGGGAAIPAPRPSFLTPDLVAQATGRNPAEVDRIRPLHRPSGASGNRMSEKNGTSLISHDRFLSKEYSCHRPNFAATPPWCIASPSVLTASSSPAPASTISA